MPRDQHPDPAAADPDKPDREHREYPHGTGDRNSYSPTRSKDPMPRHDGGSQRKAPPDPGAA